MNIYVAGSSKELARVKRVMALLREGGHRITFDWTVPVEREGANPRDPKIRYEAAREDMNGIDEADAFLFLHPAPGIQTTGAWWELGYAMCASRLDLLLVSYETADSRAHTSPCIFTELLFEGIGDDQQAVLDADIMRVLSEKDIAETCF